MALTPGTRLGVYQITAPLGDGGMGQVFRARDTKLDRDVAIKVLPEAFANDPDRLARFTREAKTLAALNHPNIAHIHGLEESSGITALVMELVEGEDLSQRIARLRAPGASARQAGMPLDEALPIAKQIAEALEAAHDPGIIHRDLKPAIGDATGQRVTSIRTAWEAARERAGLADLHLADLRHEAASRLEDAGVPTTYVSKFLGHRNLSTTTRYLNATIRGLRLAVEKLEESRRKAARNAMQTAGARRSKHDSRSRESTPPESFTS